MSDAGSEHGIADDCCVDFLHFQSPYKLHYHKFREDQTYAEGECLERYGEKTAAQAQRHRVAEEAVARSLRRVDQR